MKKYMSIVVLLALASVCHANGGGYGRSYATPQQFAAPVPSCGLSGCQQPQQFAAPLPQYPPQSYGGCQQPQQFAAPLQAPAYAQQSFQQSYSMRQSFAAPVYAPQVQQFAAPLAAPVYAQQAFAAPVYGGYGVGVGVRVGGFRRSGVSVVAPGFGGGAVIVNSRSGLFGRQRSTIVVR